MTKRREWYWSQIFRDWFRPYGMNGYQNIRTGELYDAAHFPTGDLIHETIARIEGIATKPMPGCSYVKKIKPARGYAFLAPENYLRKNRGKISCPDCGHKMEFVQLKGDMPPNQRFLDRNFWRCKVCGYESGKR